ncbi:MAG TPA: hypothetical protein VIX82_05015 [Solirubrobacteraceae bacterium]
MKLLKRSLAMVAIAGLSVGCGSTINAPPAVGAAFASRALAVCKTAAAEKKAAGSFPYPDFNPTQPDASKFPGIARFEVKIVQNIKKWQREMLALGQPPTGQGAWANVLRALDSHVGSTIAQHAAAQRGDSQTFTRTYHEGRIASAEILSAATAAGVPACAAILQ